MIRERANFQVLSDGDTDLRSSFLKLGLRPELCGEFSFEQVQPVLQKLRDEGQRQVHADRGGSPIERGRVVGVTSSQINEAFGDICDEPELARAGWPFNSPLVGPLRDVFRRGEEELTVLRRTTRNMVAFAAQTLPTGAEEGEGIWSAQRVLGTPCECALLDLERASRALSAGTSDAETEELLFDTPAENRSGFLDRKSEGKRRETLASIYQRHGTRVSIEKSGVITDLAGTAPVPRVLVGALIHETPVKLLQEVGLTRPRSNSASPLLLCRNLTQDQILPLLSWLEPRVPNPEVERGVLLSLEFRGAEAEPRFALEGAVLSRQLLEGDSR